MQLSDNYYSDIEGARKAYKNGDLLLAIELFENATNDIALEDDILDLGLLYMENGEFEKAYQTIIGVISDLPDHSRGYYCLGYIFEEIADNEKALENYHKAFELEKGNQKYAFSLARLYDDLNCFEKAIEYYRISISLKKDDFWSCLNLGSLYERTNELDIALEYTLKAYTINPKKEMVNYNLGVIYARKEEYELALRHYLEEVDNKDCYPLTYFNLGILYKDIYKDFIKAKYYYLKGIQIDSDNVSLWYNLGCLYACLNNYDDAYQCFLLSCMKNKKVLETLKADNELIEFRKTSKYEKLINEVSKIW